VKRRSLKTVLLWMVPLLLARSLIPAGFMLMGGTNGLELMFCSGSMQMASPHALQHSQHAGHEGHADHDAAMHAARQQADHGSPGTDQKADRAPCPFAIAACAATLDVPFLQVPAAAPVDESLVATIVSVSTFRGVSANPIRGPPQVS
jgi:hypothetical protein